MDDVTVELVAHTGDLLGEGPVWDAEVGTIWWTDFGGTTLHACEVATGHLRHVALPEPTGSFALRERGGLVCAMASGFAFLDPDTGAVERLAAPHPGHSFNDGKCAPDGSFWAGTMPDQPSDRSGRLFRLGLDLSVTEMAAGIGIPNGLAWSSDGTTFLMTDSLDRRLLTFETPSPGAALGPGRTFAEVREGEGTPDGGAMDVEDCYWGAEWQGGRLVRYGPEGAVRDVVPLPVTIPTSCAFGGPDLRTLFVTTSRWDMGPEALAREPWAGGLLAIQAPAPGLAVARFAG